MESKMLTPAEITKYAEEVGVKKATNKFSQTLLLAILAGIFIALGAFGAAVASHSITNVGLQKFIAGIVFPVGLMMVLICGGELFTGNSLLIIPWASKKISTKELMKNWTIVFIGNFIGAVIVATLIYFSGLLEIGTVGGYAVKVATNKANLSFTRALTSGILCNIIVSLAVWGSYAAKDVTGKIFMGFFPIFAFVISGFEHCVANMYYFSIGLFAKLNPVFVEGSHMAAEKLGNLNTIGLINNLIPVTIGNIIGGAFIVGMTYWYIYIKNSPNKDAKHREKKAA